ncbi:hypothetical protein Bhyg_03041 [Pseudolycoriella hygida]|uniref:Uncharacterized protein n=1 Tax=Pseudolycoriella hygida TaxID=35572 RepID=A0A9Q0NCX7_9DIPT|nr:hypothetical protein Bhyg_03041 [Pseudolycoriella hygida]
MICNSTYNVLQTPLSHYAKNQRIPRNRSVLTEKLNKAIAEDESNVYTKLALGSCMETLMKTPRQTLPKQLSAEYKQQRDDSSSLCANVLHKGVQNLKKEESIGRPIPVRRYNSKIDDHTKQYLSFMNSPPTGQCSPNYLMYGSPPVSSASQHLDVYGSGGSGKVSRAASPQPLFNVGGAIGDYRTA